jgi:uncharacterized protein (TIGR00290 family)
MNSRNAPAFVSWSGGKDSCLALHRAVAAGRPVLALFCMLHEGGAFSHSHGVSREALAAQAEALGLPVRFGSATWEGYEAAFKEEVGRMRGHGVAAGVFGDIDLAEHRAWVERVCRELGIEPLLPLWGQERRELVMELVNLGYRAVIISVRMEYLSREWLGRVLDLSALRELEAAGVDPCGEGGEFHTFDVSGPHFAPPVA